MKFKNKKINIIHSFFVQTTQHKATCIIPTRTIRYITVAATGESPIIITVITIIWKILNI